ncbi:hypothetical protein EIP91_010831 [Steccherinum ochraceum]|uniref:Pre-mRNA-processing protein prp40 n=1 Tax=Steccherinum ochraceum TaxID=92696 RepID=A0A4R0RIL4_9APHY|nr:hypothetical protein EIP91_010831 [Steccherinum ochraceum]
MNVWTEHTNPEGRTYWFHTGTKESVWEKPDDLKTPFERALNQTKWKEYFSGGRKYYYNTDTKESKWDMPDELLLLLEKVEKEGPAGGSNNALVTRATGTQGAANPLAGGDASSSTALQTQVNGTNGEVRPLDSTALPFQSASILPARPNLPDDPVIPHNGFMTVEEGEKAFMHLLRKAGVDANWTWDQTMRSIITDPLYKALNTLAEKKAAWQKYTDTLKAKEQEERDARLSKLRPAIRNMLKGNPNVFHYTTFATADKHFAQHPIWQQAKIEAERKLVFEEYVAELKQREMQESRAARSRGINTIVNMFKTLDVDVLTRWRQAHKMIVDSEEWQNDTELQQLPTLDILLAFEDYSRVREREFEEQMRRAQVEKTRKERKAREGFKSLLKELVDDGKLKARTKWKQVYDLFSDDPRYLDMLGTPGSNPLELFWDVVDSLDQKLDAKIGVVESAIKRHNDQLVAAADEGAEVKTFVINVETVLDDYLAVVKADSSEAVQKLRTSELEDIFTNLRDQAVKQQADEKRRAERRQRHLQDDLRYALRKLSDPIDVSTSYEEALPIMQDLPEFKAIEDEESRRIAFAKYVKRQKERLREKERDASEDGGSTTSRRRREPERDRGDRDRDRDREYREKDRDVDRDRDSSTTKDRSSRHHDHARRSSRDYNRDRDHKERDHYKSSSSRHHREYERDKEDRRRDSASRKGTREWVDEGHSRDEKDLKDRERERERSASVYKDDPREKRDRSVFEDKPVDERSEKRARYDDDAVPEGKPKDATAREVREETPEEGEI